MKRLLRSIIDIAGISQENLVFNFTRLRDAVDAGRLVWGRTDDEKVYAFAFQYFSAQLEMASLATVQDYFTRIDDIEVLERLRDIEAAQFYVRTNFGHLLKQLVEEQRKLGFVAVLKKAHDIAVRGVEVDGEKHVGVDAAYQCVIEGGRALLEASGRTREHHDLRAEATQVIEEYLDAEAHPEKRLGAFTGLVEIDMASGGARNGELWVHAAFTGELKSTWALNYAYNAVTQFGRNVVYVSFEMPEEQVRRSVYAIHSENRKWVRDGIRPAGFPGLDCRKIRDGQLTADEKNFFVNYVAPDFATNPRYCHFDVIRPARPKTTLDVQTDLELLDRGFEVGLVVLDHGQWIEPRKGRRNKDYVIELNAIVRESKELALSFAGGRGVPVLLLWQINREGKDDADKNDGTYKARHLTYANEVEKTADVITTSYLNEQLRALGRAKFGNLKNRDNPLFKPFEARVQFAPRRITSLERCGAAGSAMEVSDDRLNEH